MFLTLCTLFATTSESSAVTIFSDSFEYTDSPASHGWVLTNSFGSSPGIIETSTSKSYDGSYSLYLGSSRGVRHDFGEMSSSLIDTVSVRYYDDMLSGTNWDVSARLSFNNMTANTDLFFYNGPNYWYRSPSGEFTTTIERTSGWHEFLWDITTPNTVSMYIDGTLAGSYSGPLGTVSYLSLVIGQEPPLYGYFDKVEVLGTQPVPEPTTIALLGIGLAGAAVRRRLKNAKS